jgi:hypothetical protein
MIQQGPEADAFRQRPTQTRALGPIAVVLVPAKMLLAPLLLSEIIRKLLLFSC